MSLTIDRVGGVLKENMIQRGDITIHKFTVWYTPDGSGFGGHFTARERALEYIGYVCS